MCKFIAKRRNEMLYWISITTLIIFYILIKLRVFEGFIKFSFPLLLRRILIVSVLICFVFRKSATSISTILILWMTITRRIWFENMIFFSFSFISNHFICLVNLFKIFLIAFVEIRMIFFDKFVVLFFNVFCCSSLAHL